MLARQQATGKRVIYLAVWDGDTYAPEARALAPHDYNRWGTLVRGMPRKRWNDTVKALAKELEELVRGCPDHPGRDAGSARVATIGPGRHC